MELSGAECPVDRIMRGEYVERMPDPEYMLHEYRDRSLDEAEDTLREESEYWNGIEEIEDDWFFQED